MDESGTFVVELGEPAENLSEWQWANTPPTEPGLYQRLSHFSEGVYYSYYDNGCWYGINKSKIMALQAFKYKQVSTLQEMKWRGVIATTT